MAQLLPRLIIILFLVGVVAWLALDVMRNVKTKSYPAMKATRWGQVETPTTQPINFWPYIALKAVGVVAAATLAIAYILLGAIK